MLLVRIIGEDHLAIRYLEHDDGDHLALEGEEVAQEDLVSVIIATLGLIHLRLSAVAAASYVEQGRVPVLDGCRLDDKDLVFPDGRIAGRLVHIVDS